MVVADAGAWNTGPDVGAALPYRDVWRSTFAERDAADAVFAEVDAHAFAQADAFADPESHALPFDSVSLASHYMAFGGWLRYSNTSRSECSSSSQPAHGFPWDTLKCFPAIRLLHWPVMMNIATTGERCDPVLPWIQ